MKWAGVTIPASGVLLGRIDGSVTVWYHLPIGCTLEGILSINQHTNSKRPSMIPAVFKLALN